MKDDALAERMRGVVAELRARHEKLNGHGSDWAEWNEADGVKYAADLIEAALKPPTDNDRAAEEMDVPQD